MEAAKKSSPVQHLVLDRLSKRIGNQEILKDISFEVRLGEVFGIVGPDGSGKSSLLKVIAGVWQPSAGTVALNGEPFARLPDFLRQRVGYMAFEEGLYEDLTALENLEFTANLYNIPRADARFQMEYFLNKTNLVEFKDLAVKNFSGGMKQKLALCCALIHRPSVLLLDEPSTGIDPLSRRKFWELLYDLPQEEVAILITTPYFEEIARCQQVALLSEGRIILSGDPRQLYEHSGWRAFDLWPDRLFPAMELLEDEEGIKSYRVRGHSIHVVFPKELSPEKHLVNKLEASGIKLNQYEDSHVEVEDLFYLHLKSLSPEFSQDKSWEGARLPRQDSEVDSVIQADGLVKRFGPVEAVRGASFEVARGEIFGLIGSNGAGKTTLLRMLCGLLGPTSGKVTLFGKDPMEHQAWVQNKIAYLSQEFSLYSDLTVVENLRFYGGIYGLSEKLLRERSDWALEITGMKTHGHLKVKDLPTGWKQRLALGCSLVHDPAVIFLDEPTSGVDPVTRRYLWHWISYLTELGRTVIVTTHYMTEAEQCHQIMLMHHGEVLAQGSPGQLCSADRQTAMLIEINCEPVRGAIRILKDLPWVYSVIPYGNHLHLMTSKEEDHLSEIRGQLARGGIHLHYISPVPYSIEDVFVEEIRNR